MAHTAERVLRHESNSHPTEVHSTSYIDIIQGSSTLIECLQILERFCAKETLKSKVNHTETGNTSNLHKESNRMQRQEGDNQNPRTQM